MSFGHTPACVSATSLFAPPILGEVAMKEYDDGYRNRLAIGCGCDHCPFCGSQAEVSGQRPPNFHPCTTPLTRLLQFPTDRGSRSDPRLRFLPVRLQQPDPLVVPFQEDDSTPPDFFLVELFHFRTLVGRYKTAWQIPAALQTWPGAHCSSESHGWQSTG